MVHLPDPVLSRRTLLAGGLALGATSLLAACGSSDGGSTSGTSPDSGGAGSSDGAAGAGDAQLVAFFDQSGAAVVAGIPQRLVFGLGDSQGALLDSGPDTLSFTINQVGDPTAVGEPIVATRHDEGLPRAYYPVSIDLPDVGDYQVSTRIDGRKLDAAFHLSSAAQVAIPQAGAPMPNVPTPTVADAQGVDPICTATPECPLHDVSLTTALTQGKPVALLISTPAFCQVAICGPVLDVLLSQRPEFGDKVQMIHAEVYKSGEQASKDPSNAQLAPIVEAFHLPFEPTIILANADGTIAERLDNIFDEGELRQALGRLVA